MAILLGNNGAAVSYGYTNGNNYYHWYLDGYVAVAGTAETAFIENGPEQTASAEKLAIHNSSGTLVAVTGAITITHDAVNSAAISASLTGGATYYLPYVADGYNNVGFVDAATWKVAYELDSYATPGNISLPPSENNQPQIRAWIESAAGGALSVNLSGFGGLAGRGGLAGIGGGLVN
jgi:hypothetical protein